MKRCLIVDDSKVIRLVARKILQELNFDTDEAVDGHEAIEICQKAMPDGVLLDEKMPVLTGIEFLHELRKMPGGNTPLVVFCTTDKDLTNIQGAIEAGANEYIMKPFDLKTIKEKFTQVGLL